MKPEDRILAALRVLAEQDAELEAPLAVEDRVRRAFRRKHAQRKWRAIGLWGLAAAAMITIGVALGTIGRTPERPPTPAAPPSVATRAPQVVAELPVPGPKAPARLPPKTAAPRREIVTQFFPLLDASMPFERGELLRMTVPASTMRRVGLPVNEDRLGDRITADVLVGEEGIARAIRFVSYEQ